MRVGDGAPWRVRFSSFGVVRRTLRQRAALRSAPAFGLCATFDCKSMDICAPMGTWILFQSRETGCALQEDGSWSEESERAYRVLKDVLDLTNTQLQFAEAKNAALLAVSLATIIGVGAVLSSEMLTVDSVRLWLLATCSGLGISAFVALLSILPIYGGERHHFIKGVELTSKHNLLFFGDIAAISPTAYLVAVFDDLSVSPRPRKLHADLANQIVINSNIAKRKYRYFEAAAYITAASASIPFLVLCGIWLGRGGHF